MATSSARTIALADAPPPAIGLGLWKVTRSDAPTLVEEAIRVGYRHIDSACDYGNEVEAGQGIRSAVEKGLCRREDLWITSKLWNTYHEPQHVRPAVERSLHDLGLDSLDLYLVHFPIALEYVPFEVTGFSPLGAPSYVPLGMATAAESVLDHPVVTGIAAAIGRTPAQVVLRWGMQRGTAVIPKTSRPERLRENLAACDVSLSSEQMQAISSLDRGRRFNDPGDFCERAFGTFFPIYE